MSSPTKNNTEVVENVPAATTETSQEKVVVGGIFNEASHIEATPTGVLSEEEALKIAENGDFDVIDREIQKVEDQLAGRPAKTRWYNYELNFKDPRHFNWLLVAFASMGGLLSGSDKPGELHVF